ncbi:unnamed protein product [Nesidiocoris tenuis]|uniref:Uncharacterized protein n=1 Tax=Nesidiocoris tenuis TaxID=355587 RepID=A0A6H5FUD4_9HEMI|nr:unnamed protein product [Nesidiocoris tenuis]
MRTDENQNRSIIPQSFQTIGGTGRDREMRLSTFCSIFDLVSHSKCPISGHPEHAALIRCFEFSQVRERPHHLNILVNSKRKPPAAVAIGSHWASLLIKPRAETVQLNYSEFRTAVTMSDDFPIRANVQALHLRQRSFTIHCYQHFTNNICIIYRASFAGWRPGWRENSGSGETYITFRMCDCWKKSFPDQSGTGGEGKLVASASFFPRAKNYRSSNLDEVYPIRMRLNTNLLSESGANAFPASTVFITQPPRREIFKIYASGPSIPLARYRWCQIFLSVCSIQKSAPISQRPSTSQCHLACEDFIRILNRTTCDVWRKCDPGALWYNVLPSNHQTRLTNEADLTVPESQSWLNNIRKEALRRVGCVSYGRKLLTSHLSTLLALQGRSYLKIPPTSPNCPRTFFFYVELSVIAVDRRKKSRFHLVTEHVIVLKSKIESKFRKNIYMYTFTLNHFQYKCLRLRNIQGN